MRSISNLGSITLIVVNTAPISLPSFTPTTPHIKVFQHNHEPLATLKHRPHPFSLSARSLQTKPTNSKVPPPPGCKMNIFCLFTWEGLCNCYSDLGKSFTSTERRLEMITLTKFFELLKTKMNHKTNAT